MSVTLTDSELQTVLKALVVAGASIEKVLASDTSDDPMDAEQRRMVTMLALDLLTLAESLAPRVPCTCGKCHKDGNPSGNKTPESSVN